MTEIQKNPNAKLVEDWKNLTGTTILNIPFPKEWDDEDLKKLHPIVIKWEAHQNYIISYGQDSPWFAALSNGQLIGTKCKICGFTTANPKLSCQECYSPNSTEWVKLSDNARIHAFTVCYFGAEAFQDQTPFILGYIEFDDCDTLLLSRVIGLDVHDPSLDWIGMEVKSKFSKLTQISPLDVYFVPR